MTTQFSEYMLSQIANSGFSWASRNMGVILLYRSARILNTGDNPAQPTVHSPYDVPGLLAQLGFQEVSTSTSGGSPTYLPYPSTNPGVYQAVNADTATDPGLTHIVYGADWAPIPTGANAASVYVAAALFYIKGTVGTVTDPWMMITDDAFADTMQPGTRITGNPRRLFTYVLHGTAPNATINITVDQILRSPGTLTWESARIQHVYMVPQRVNLVPNPSFENVTPFGWRSDAAMTRTQGGVDNPSNYYMAVAGKVLESLAVPVYPQFRFSAYVRAHGGTQVRLLLGFLDSTYTVVTYADGGYPWRPLYNTWTRYDALIGGLEDSIAVVPHIEADGPFDCDMVLLENVASLNPYWDGDSQTGMPGDFTWQSTQAQSYSFWYNNKYVTASRLFGPMVQVPVPTVPDPNQARNGQVAGPGLVFDWVPTGTSVMAHWNVLSQQDTGHPLEDWGSRTGAQPAP